MKTAAIISEFNPFHNGHKYLVDKIKCEYAQSVVAIMSGNFVQRGDVAIIDKHRRAQTALENGCDLVVELPTVFAVSSAQHFAKGGVEIASALNSDFLCFAAEDADTKKLTKIAYTFNSDEFSTKLRDELSRGSYYPKAVCATINALLGKEYSEILSKPNNTLAIEYIKALKNTSISPIAIRRIGAEHDSCEVVDNISSASHIRNLIHENKSYSDFSPALVPYHTDINKLQTAILYKIKTMTKEELENLPDVTEGLHNRIYECAKFVNSLNELYETLKTKRYTLARLRRIIISALLGITKEDAKCNAQYIRVLGMNDNGAKLLSDATLPLVCKFPQDYDKLFEKGKRMLDIDLNAGKVFSLSTNIDGAYQNELKTKLIKI